MSDLPGSNYEGLHPGQLARALNDMGAGTGKHAEIRAVLDATLAAQLASAIDRHAAASDKLASKVHRLNVVIGILTAAGVVVALLQLVKG